ncbi:MAG: DNA translocase FtsK, partial [Candidatus Riflebacteria bacterium]|nr:DNA translocase FtsK [Candidatus Riflebacteria bacterium]
KANENIEESNSLKQVENTLEQANVQAEAKIENPVNQNEQLNITNNIKSNDEEEAQIIPIPKLYNQEVETKSVEEEKESSQTSTNNSSIQISNISSECIFVNTAFSVIAANVSPETDNVVTETETETPHPTDSVSEKTTIKLDDDAKEILGYSENEENNVEERIEAKKSVEPPEITSKVVEQKESLSSEEGEITLPEKTFEEKEQVYLEDNRIDHEIKEAEKEEAPKNINKYAHCKLPPLEILKIPPVKVSNADIQSELSYRSAHLLKTLGEFGIKATITDIVQGPAVSRFELKPAPGVKVRQITSLTDDIALSLAAQSIAIEAPIPGKSALGIIIPNSKPTPVYFYNLLNNDEFLRSPNLLQIAVGVTINGTNIYYNLAEMPHLLIAGSTGSGKSVCVNSIIASILFKARPDQVKFIMIDPKMVELSGYNGIPHLIAPVVTDPAKASGALMWAVEEMERRYELLSRCQGVKNISTYNEKLEELREEVDPSFEPMPYIVIVIDELADLMMTCSAEVEGSICRLTQMARAVGMHLIIATQRPSVNVITGLIKANLPSRIAFSVSSQVDSKTILDSAGAEKLLGKGDMLFLPKGLSKPRRLQGPYVSDNELNDLINFVKSQGKP